jgi:hypothetical protein
MKSGMIIFAYTLVNQTKKSTFSVSVDEMEQDFDFSASLKLFDKNAIFNEIRYDHTFNVSESDSTAPESRLVSHNRRDPQRKLKNNENVLESPVTHIESTSKTVFKTLNGLNVPCVDAKIKTSFENMAVEIGLFDEIMIENGGRTMATLILQALGGNRRIKPGSNFDPPYVLILAGNSKTGAIALSGARHLLNHGCRVDCLIERDSSHVGFTSFILVIFPSEACIELPGSDFS